MVEDDASIRQSLLLLLSTSPGERVMRPDYGCSLRRLVFAPNDDTTAGLAIHYVRQAVERWEPRVEILASMPVATRSIPERLRHRPRLPRPGHPPGRRHRVSARPRPERRADAARIARTSTTAPCSSSSTSATARIRQVAPDWTDLSPGDPGIVLRRGLRLPDRVADLPAQPGPGQAVHRVPPAHRRPAPAAGRRRRSTLAFTREEGVDRADRDPARDARHDRPPGGGSEPPVFATTASAIDRRRPTDEAIASAPTTPSGSRPSRSATRPASPG